MSLFEKQRAAFDFETRLIEYGKGAPLPVCISYDDAQDRGVTHLWRFKLLQLGEQNEKLVAHNLPFDWTAAYTHAPALRWKLWDWLDEGKFECSMLAQRLMNVAYGRHRKRPRPNLQETLIAHDINTELEKGADEAKALAKEYGSLHRVPARKLPWRYKYATLINTPVEEYPLKAFEYAQEDATACLQVRLNQCLWIDAEELPTEQLEVRASVALKLMSLYGMGFDKDETREYRLLLEDERLGAIPALLETGLAAFQTQREAKKYEDTGDLHGLRVQMKMQPKRDLIAAAWNEEELGPIPRTDPTSKFPEGQIKTDDKTIQKCEALPEFKDLKAYSVPTRILTNYVRKMDEMPGDRVHADFKEIMQTSRTSSGGGINMQNQPRKGAVRNLFKPAPGHSFIAADYANQEMRTLGQCTWTLFEGESELARAFRANKYFDAHQALADSSAFDRDKCKVTNFALPGGMVAKTLVAYALGYGIRMTLSEAEQLCYEWHVRWPEMRRFFSYVKGITRSPGRQVFVPTTGFCRGRVGYTDGCNTHFQGLGAACTKNALYNVTRACYDERLESVLLGSRVVNMIHDELILEVPRVVEQEAANEIVRIMEQSQEVYTPDVPAWAQASISLCWLKEAKEIFLADDEEFEIKDEESAARASGLMRKVYENVPAC